MIRGYARREVGLDLVVGAKRRKSQTTIRSWLYVLEPSDSRMRGSPNQGAIAADVGLRILDSDTWTCVLSITADCRSIGSDMIVGSSEMT